MIADCISGLSSRKVNNHTWALSMYSGKAMTNPTMLSYTWGITMASSRYSRIKATSRLKTMDIIDKNRTSFLFFSF